MKKPNPLLTPEPHKSNRRGPFRGTFWGFLCGVGIGTLASCTLAALLCSLADEWNWFLVVVLRLGLLWGATGAAAGTIAGASIWRVQSQTGQLSCFRLVVVPVIVVMALVVVTLLANRIALFGPRHRLG